MSEAPTQQDQQPEPAPQSFHDFRDVPGDLKRDRFEIPPAYLDPVPYWGGRR